ncbi:MAG: ADP-heptose:LPS heptosyltransferase [Patiriisocius sp.]
MATAILEKLHEHNAGMTVDLLVRKGNESLVKDHPKLNEILIWDKNNGKYKALRNVLKVIRKNRYEAVVNLQRFGSTGMLTAFSKAKYKVGFDKNPFSFLFTHKVKHEMNGIHEVDRNLSLLSFMGIEGGARPKLYPSELTKEKVRAYKSEPFVCMAPSSVWYTKQWPWEKWVELIQETKEAKIYLLGAPDDFEYCENIRLKSGVSEVHNLAGKLNLLQSAALMEDAKMNFVNDSAPMHLASAVNAPVTAIYCSTIPKFGFGPLSDQSKVVETDEKLDCRPCGLHGFKACPKGHFNCAKTISIQKVLER